MSHALAAFAALTLLSSPLHVQDEASDVDEGDAIACRLAVPDYMGFALAIDGKDGIARTRGWKEVRSANSFLREYDLPREITVAGAWRTRRIAFTGDSILAVLDVADPAEVARAEKIENSVSADVLIDSLAKASGKSRAAIAGEIKFRKFLGEQVVSDETQRAAGESVGSRMTVVHTISNATTHPGKTFYGCAYRLQMLDEGGSPL